MIPADALEIVTLSNPGRVRTNNEDAVVANPQWGIAVLADGMGGYNAGEVASEMATKHLAEALEKAFQIQPPGNRDVAGQSWAQTVIENEVSRANAAIYSRAQSHPQFSGMGTTLVMGVFHDNRVTVGHIGDSRLYRLRGEEFVAITRDHSLLQEQIDAGIVTLEQARFSQNRNLVTRALGVDPEVKVEVHEHAVLPGDVYVFCSDGLNDMVEDEEIGMTVGMLSANLQVCADQLIQMACDNGGKDNVSVILVKIKAEFPVTGGWWSRFKAWFN